MYLICSLLRTSYLRYYLFKPGTCGTPQTCIYQCRISLGNINTSINSRHTCTNEISMGLQVTIDGDQLKLILPTAYTPSHPTTNALSGKQPAVPVSYSTGWDMDTTYLSGARVMSHMELIPLAPLAPASIVDSKTTKLTLCSPARIPYSPPSESEHVCNNRQRRINYKARATQPLRSILSNRSL